MIEKLLSLNSRADVPDIEAQTPMDIAIRYGNKEAAEFLTEALKNRRNQDPRGTRARMPSV
jgi:ankyrin repeat protein